MEDHDQLVELQKLLVHLKHKLVLMRNGEPRPPERLIESLEGSLASMARAIVEAKKVLKLNQEHQTRLF